MIIYCATNNINKKMYVGQTIQTLRNRRNEHQSFSQVALNAMAISKAINKYGKDNFTWFILRDCDSYDEMNFWERFYIQLLQTQEYGYNIRPGGANSPLADSTKQKISEKLKNNKNGCGHKMSVENKEQLRSLNKNKVVTIETREKMSKHKLGNKNLLGFKHREESNKKNAISHMGRTYNIGHKVSEETRRKISEANKRYNQLKKQNL